ncbi:MAG TPA: glycosyltransferase [Gaiellaceae bacterium]
MISVVIPTLGRRDSLLRALDALAQQDIPSTEYEVVVSVDGDDATAQALGSYSAPFTLHVVGGARSGRAAACNAGIDRATGDVLVILDDDMEPAPACLRTHREHHAGEEKVCVMGGVPIRTDRKSPSATRYMAWKFDRHLASLARPGHEFALRDFYSGNTSVRRDMLVAAGRYDEAYRLYGNEDLELSLRLRTAGVRLVYDGDALAYQHYEKDLRGLVNDTVEKGKTAVQLARAYPDTLDQLQLARYDDMWPAWRAVRSVLLRRHSLSAAVLFVARLIERTPLARPLFYVLLLDYFYWVGVQAELDADLRDGPIRLLLHR